MQTIPGRNAPDADIDSSTHLVERPACAIGGGEPPVHRLMRLPPRSRAEAILQRRLVLVAQSNKADQLQRRIDEQLTLLGYVVDVATDGDQALQLWRSGDYALLFTDLRMPRMDGYALTRAIRGAEARGARLPIVALTANTPDADTARCRAAGMDDCLDPPVLLEQLAAMVEKWLPDRHILSPTEPEPLPEDTVTLDIRMMQELVGDEPELTRELLASFQTRACLTAHKIGEAIRTAQYRAVADAAHSLKSSAHMVGAIPLSRLCQIAEHAAQNMDLLALQSLLPEFEAEMQAVQRELNSALAA